MNYGIILVGTNINPLVISLNNMFDNNVEKIFLLATPKENYEKSTENFCDRTIEIFKDKNLKKILIDKSNINLIKKSIDNEVLKVIEEDKDLVKGAIDFSENNTTYNWRNTELKDFDLYKYNEELISKWLS